MTPSQFTIWLAGFLEAAGTNGLQQYQVNKILDVLIGVDHTPPNTIPNPVPYTTTDDKVPYSTICGCNPANGGSGICGCIMGNTMVPKNYHTKSNIYTTTIDNIPFNWQFKDHTK